MIEAVRGLLKENQVQTPQMGGDVIAVQEYSP